MPTAEILLIASLLLVVGVFSIYFICNPVKGNDYVRKPYYNEN